ncbi:MAG: murein biosynthesis integral membrane protein MurJ [Bacteriovoracia bacterium]
MKKRSNTTSAEPLAEDQTSRIARNAGRMGLATLISRVLGLAREQVFAFLFGASDAADAFNIAFRIPNLLRDLFAEGAMSAAFVPNFAKALLRSRQAAFDVLGATLSILFVGLGFLSLLGIAFSPELVSLYANSFANVAGKLELTVGLTRAMFPFFPLVAMAAVTMGALNSLGFYFLPAFAPALFNVASILCGLVLVPVFQHTLPIPPIYAMAVGVVLGGFLQFYVQWWKVRKEGFTYAQLIKTAVQPLAVPEVKQVLFLLIPGTLGLAATQLSILINSIYATSQGTGAVSWLNYAFRFMQFPIGIFGVSLAAATLPQISTLLAQNEAKTAGKEIRKSLQMCFAVNFPAAAGLMALGVPIVQLIFEHGHFTFFDTSQTATALFWYGFGLPAYSVVKILVPVFYALGSTKTPVFVSFVAVALNTFLNHLFLTQFHFPFWALAIATSVTSILNATVLLLLVSKKIPAIMHRSLIGAVFIHSVSGLGVALVCYGFIKGFQIISVWIPLLHSKYIFNTLVLFCTLPAVLFIWAWFGRQFDIEEIRRATNLFSRKLKRHANNK